MRIVARLITPEVCPRCSPTSMLSGVRVLVSPPVIHLHQCIVYLSSTKPTQAGQARLLLPPRDSIISSSVVARLPACQPAGSLVFS